jgi:WD40 repeat protein
LATSLVAAGLACSTFTGSSHQQMDLGPGPSLIRYSSFNGRQLLIGDSLWDVESGKELQHFRVAHPFYITATRFNPDGRRALTATAQHFGTLDLGGPVILWDVATGREISRFAPHDGYVFDVQLSPDGRRMLAVLTGTQSNSNAIQIWDVNSAQRLLVVQGLWTPLFGPPAARYVSFSPDGGRLVVLSFRTITIWDAVTGKRICTMEPQKGTAKPDFLVATQFSPDGRFVLTEQCNGVTRIWNAATGRQVQAFAVTIHSAQYWPYALFTPDGRGVISGSDDGIAILWQIESGKEIRRFQIPGPGRAPVYQMVISRDGKRLIAICESARKNDPKQGVSLWDVESGRLIKQFYGHEEIVGFSPCDETFVTVNNRKPAALWDGATGEIIREYK